MAMLYLGMENWNDLKLVLAIHRAGTLAGGAAELSVNHSTAFRRLNALEERVGTRLFERLPGGAYLPTPEGERFSTTAERVEAETAALDRDVTGRDTRLTGSLRVTSSETLAYAVLTSELARFRQVHPGIVVEMVIDNRVLSLSRREADIALRVTRPKEPDLFGRKLADTALLPRLPLELCVTIALLPIGAYVWLLQPELPPRAIAAYGVACALLCTCACTLVDESGRPNSLRALLLLLGDASYSIYLVHGFVIQPLAGAWMHLVGRRLPALFLLTMACAVALTAIMTYKLIEKPSLESLRRLGQRKPVTA